MKSKNKLIELECHRLSSDGSGIGYDQGIVTFVPGLLPGEKGKVIVHTQKKKWQRGSLEIINHRSSLRINPPCRVFEICGGCQLQHLDYHETIKWKSQWVKDALQRVGKIEVNVNSTIGMEFPWRYRNKARLHCDKSGRIGYYHEKTNSIVNFPDCLLLSDQMNSWIRAFKQIVQSDNFLKEHIYQIDAITFRENTEGIGLILFEHSFSDENLAEFKEIMELTIKDSDSNFDDINMIWGLTTEGSPELMVDREQFSESMFDLTFEISPLAFLQVNKIQTKVLYSIVLDWAQLSGTDYVWDLYSGIGSITLAVAKHAQKVKGIEENPFAVADAKRNAKANQIENVEFLQGKVEDCLSELEGSPDLIIVDPPRAGLHSLVIEQLLRIKPKKLIYVSCDPGTLARDTGLLVNGGYEVVKVQPVDMFPWTQHVECVVGMQRKDT